MRHSIGGEAFCIVLYFSFVRLLGTCARSSKCALQKTLFREPLNTMMVASHWILKLLGRSNIGRGKNHITSIGVSNDSSFIVMSSAIEMNGIGFLIIINLPTLRPTAIFWHAYFHHASYRLRYIVYRRCPEQAAAGGLGVQKFRRAVFSQSHQIVILSIGWYHPACSCMLH